jgi:hypothetical protein
MSSDSRNGIRNKRLDDLRESLADPGQMRVIDSITMSAPKPE